MIRAPCSKSRILPAFRIFRVIRVAHLAYFRRFESFESFELHISRFSRESIISQQRRRENTPDYLALTDNQLKKQDSEIKELKAMVQQLLAAQDKKAATK